MIAHAACVTCGRESSRPSEMLAGASSPSWFDGLLLFSSFPHFYIFKLPLVNIKSCEDKAERSLAYKDPRKQWTLPLLDFKLWIIIHDVCYIKHNYGRGKVGGEYSHLLQMRSMITPLLCSPLHLWGFVWHFCMMHRSLIINPKGGKKKKKK